MKALGLHTEHFADPPSSGKHPTIAALAPWLRRFLASDWCLVLAVLSVSLTCFVLAERVPVGNGFGWDGVLYGNWARDFRQEVAVKQVNTYYIQRVLPSAVIHYSLRGLGIPLTDANILAAFGVYACVLLTLMAGCWCRVAHELRIGLAGKWLGFAAFFLNYIALKYVFYCPASTDINAYALGLAMLFCYLQGRTCWLAAFTLLGAFCWPLCVHAGAIMLIFPRSTQSPAPPVTAVPLQFGAALLLTSIVALGILIPLQEPPTLRTVFVQPEYITPYRSALSLSVAICLTYVFLGSLFLFGSGCLFSPRFLFSARRVITTLLVVLGIVVVRYAQTQMSRQQPVDSYTVLLAQTAHTAIVRPGIFLVTHIAFYGPVFILAGLLWRSTCRQMQEHGGPALTLCVLIGLVLSLNSQSRYFLNLFPLLIPFVIKAAEQLNGGRRQLGCFVVISLLVSKVWFTINTGPFHGRLHEFPDQGLFMNHGPWISPTMYVVQGCAYAFLGLILYLSWFHARVGAESPQLPQSSETPATRAAA